MPVFAYRNSGLQRPACPRAIRRAASSASALPGPSMKLANSRSCAPESTTRSAGCASGSGARLTCAVGAARSRDRLDAIVHTAHAVRALRDQRSVATAQPVAAEAGPDSAAPASRLRGARPARETTRRTQPLRRAVAPPCERPPTPHKSPSRPNFPSSRPVSRSAPTCAGDSPMRSPEGQRRFLRLSRFRSAEVRLRTRARTRGSSPSVAQLPRFASEFARHTRGVAARSQRRAQAYAQRSATDWCSAVSKFHRILRCSAQIR